MRIPTKTVKFCSQFCQLVYGFLRDIYARTISLPASTMSFILLVCNPFPDLNERQGKGKGRRNESISITLWDSSFERAKGEETVPILKFLPSVPYFDTNLDLTMWVTLSALQ